MNCFTATRGRALEYHSAVNAPVSALSSNSGNGSASTGTTGTTGHSSGSSGSTSGSGTTAGGTLQTVTGGLGL